MALSYVTISELATDQSGANLSGSAVFQPSVTVYSSGVPQLLIDVPITASVINGQLKTSSGAALTLLATDNAGLSFEGQSSLFFYTVTLTLSGQAMDPWSFQLPSSPSSRDLYSLANTGPVSFANPMTALGDLISGGVNGAPVRLAGNAAATRKFLVSQGTGTAAQAPALSALQSADLPAATQLAQGAVTLPAGTAGKGLSVGWNGTAQQWGPANGVTVLAAAPTGATAADTPAVVNAIASLVSALAFGPAALQFQDGLYQIDSNSAVIRGVSNFAVRGSGGTVIQQAPNRSALPNNTGGNVFTIADCTDFRVEGITFDGNRDVVAPLTPLTATAASGQPSVTVAAGQGSRYTVGQLVAVFGGLGSGEQNQADFWTASGVNGSAIASITPGGGAGGGDLITLSGNLTHSYAQISSTVFSDGYGPYAYAGAYLTSYQCGTGTVAGRAMHGEDQQNALHLISCQRFTVYGVTARNVWESQVKCGTGTSATYATDGCAHGTIAACQCYHGYDQGVSLWVSQDISVTGNLCDASGWAGVSMTSSDYCTVSGNHMLNSVYRVPNDTVAGAGFAIEGGRGNTVSFNIIRDPYGDGARIWGTTISFGANTANAPTTSAYLPAQTAAGTSVAVSSSTFLQAGGLYSILDGARTEAVSVASVIDATHVTFNETLLYSHPAGVYVFARIPQDNVVAGNIIDSPQNGFGIINQTAVRTTIKANVITAAGAATTSLRNGITMVYSNQGAINLPAGQYLGGNGSVVRGNDIGGCSAQAIQADSTDSLLIEGNQLHGSYNSNKPVMELDGVTDSVISGNRITDCERQGGLYLTTGTLSGTVPARLVISGNMVSRTGNEGIILVNGGDSLTVTGNKVNGCGGHAGIDLRAVTNSVIEGNTCNSNAGAGIELENNASAVGCSGNRVTGNTCRNDGSGVNVTTGAAYTQAWGILETGASNGNLYAFNELDANSNVAQISLVGAGSVQTRNIISGVIQAS